LHIGDRYPIITSSYAAVTGSGTAGSAAAAGSSSYAPAPAFNFEDLGLTMKMTPTVNGLEGVSLDIEAGFKVLSGTAVNGLPVISNRQIKSQAFLKFGNGPCLPA